MLASGSLSYGLNPGTTIHGSFDSTCDGIISYIDILISLRFFQNYHFFGA